MTLHEGLDTVAIASLGVYTETYGVDEEANLANLYASFGLLEDAPAEAEVPTIFYEGDLLVRMGFSENFSKDEVLFLTRQPNSDNYITPDGDTLTRQPFSDNYVDNNGTVYTKQEFVDDHGTTTLRFIRQSFSEDRAVTSV